MFNNATHATDYEDFVTFSNKKGALEKLYCNTTTKIIKFWKFWINDDIDLTKMIRLGVKISKHIKKLKRVTEEL